MQSITEKHAALLQQKTPANVRLPLPSAGWMKFLIASGMVISFALYAISSPADRYLAERAEAKAEEARIAKVRESRIGELVLSVDKTEQQAQALLAKIGEQFQALSDDSKTSATLRRLIADHPMPEVPTLASYGFDKAYELDKEEFVKSGKAHNIDARIEQFQSDIQRLGTYAQAMRQAVDASRYGGSLPYELKQFSKTELAEPPAQQAPAQPEASERFNFPAAPAPLDYSQVIEQEASKPKPISQSTPVQAPKPKSVPTAKPGVYQVQDW